jgi:hypothetical protein
MGMDLEGAGGYFRWTASGWASLLALAAHYGWEAVGTGPPRGVLKADWPGVYHSNDGARFYARDAAALANALERALLEMPAERPEAMDDVAAYEHLVSEAGRESLRNFIAYCRQGSFRIY